MRDQGTAARIAAFALAAVFGIELLGVPSCSRPSEASTSALRHVDRLLARGQFSEALPLAIANRAQHPTESAASWHIARAYQGLGSLAKEAEAWELYLSLSQPTTDVCLRLSDVYRLLGQPARIVATVKRCLAVDGHQAELLGDLAAASLELGDPSAARAALERAVSIDPADPQLRTRLGSLRAPRP